jgi:hypothetical protein
MLENAVAGYPLVTGSGGPQGCETSRLPHFLDSLLVDGSEVQRINVAVSEISSILSLNYSCHIINAIQHAIGNITFNLIWDSSVNITTMISKD